MKSVLHKLLLSSSLIILLPMGLAIFWTSRTMSDLLERRFVEMSRAHAEQVRRFLTEKQETATGLVHWIAEMPGVRSRLVAKDRAGLFQHLLPLVGSVEMDFIEVLDDQGEIFLRVHDPYRYGDRPALAEDVQRLLNGIRDLSNYGVERRDGRVYLRAAESIHSEPLVGVVSAGYALDRHFIEKMERVTGGRVTITIGNRVYSADRFGEPPKEISAATSFDASQDPGWHREGPNPSLEIRLPLETDRGQEGVISLFFPSQELTTAIGTLQKNLISIALVGIVVAFLGSWVLSRRLTRPLKELVRGTEQVATGNYTGAINAHSKDEIGILALSFNRMLEELRRSKSEVESYRRQLEQKFAERGEELAETEKKRAAMVHMIAHDLKNPLLGIKKTLESLQQSIDLTEEQRKKTLHDLLSAGDLVIGMVNEMLDLYRSDFGELPLSVTRFRVQEPIQTSLRILGPELEEKRLQTMIQSNPADILLTADKRRVTRLLINLLSNAIKFSPDQTRIYVTTTCLADDASEPRLLLRVEDEGTGIPETDLPRIFDRFYSRDSGSIERGTGLGLHYCKLVAQAHHGTIWAENRSLGGFAVSVLLPMDKGLERRDAYGA